MYIYNKIIGQINIFWFSLKKRMVGRREWGHILIIALNLFVKSKSKITLIKCNNQDVTPFPPPKRLGKSQKLNRCFESQHLSLLLVA